MIEKLKTRNLSKSDAIVLKENFTFTYGDFLNFYLNDEIDKKIVFFFLSYLNQLPITHTRPSNLQTKNKFLFYSLEISSYSFSKKSMSYKLGSLSNLRDRFKSFELLTLFEKIIILVYFQERWLVLLIETNIPKFLIVDFLSLNVSYSEKEIIELVQLIAKRELNSDIQNIEFYQGQKLNYIDDCGFYSLNYAYKYFDKGGRSDIKITFSQKEYFKEQILWLLLKIQFLEKEKVELFLSPDTKFPISNINKYRVEIQKSSRIFKHEEMDKSNKFHKRKFRKYDQSLDLISFPTATNPSVSISQYSNNFSHEFQEIRAKKVSVPSIEKVYSRETSKELIENQQKSELQYNSQNKNEDCRDIIELNEHDIQEMLAKIKKEALRGNVSSFKSLAISQSSLKHSNSLLFSKNQVENKQRETCENLREKEHQNKIGKIQNFGKKKSKKEKIKLPPIQKTKGNYYWCYPDQMEVLLNYYNYPQNYINYIMCMKNLLNQNDESSDSEDEDVSADEIGLFGEIKHFKDEDFIQMKKNVYRELLDLVKIILKNFLDF